MRRTPSSGPAAFVKWTPDEIQLNDRFHECVKCVHDALCGECSSQQFFLIFDFNYSRSRLIEPLHRKAACLLRSYSYEIESGFTKQFPQCMGFLLNSEMLLNIVWVVILLLHALLVDISPCNRSSSWHVESISFLHRALELRKTLTWSSLLHCSLFLFHWQSSFLKFFLKEIYSVQEEVATCEVFTYSSYKPWSASVLSLVAARKRKLREGNVFTRVYPSTGWGDE